MLERGLRRENCKRHANEAGHFLQFDEVLRARTPEFGLRNLDDLVQLAHQQGMVLTSKEALGGGTNMFLQFRFA